MQEIEAKILEVDVDAVVTQLVAAGAYQTFSGEIKAAYFDFPDGRLRQAEKTMRLRQKGDTIELALKEKIPGIGNEQIKVLDEYETLVSSYDMAQRILTGIGLEQYDSLEKQRTSYRLDLSNEAVISFELDTFPGLPTLLEIEAPGTDDLAEWVSRLGYSMDDAKSWTGHDVLCFYDADGTGN